ncbi:MAG TPA: twin-arginine translocase subunit TatC [Polyangiales bacterium]|jgi:sec-independent protein translocase protein TatC|nr:twin-arginine translocase subunit TatC [Polyangiales bacterium]
MSNSLDRPAPQATALATTLNEAPPEDVPMTVLEHLGELRSRLIKALLGMIPGAWIAWEYKEYLLDYLLQPLSLAWKHLGLGEPTIHFANPVDLFVSYMKISITVGLLASSPWVFWQIWAFIAPGLYKKERRYAIPFVIASTVFFAGGAFFGYEVVFPVGFEQLLGMSGMLPSSTMRVQPTIMLTEYMGFATRMLLAFGVVFEVPVVVTFLAMVGIVNWKQLLKFGRWWVVIASIIAAVLTPPDVGSQLMMLVPLVVLYFMSVGLAYLFGPKVEPEPKADDEAGSG